MSTIPRMASLNEEVAPLPRVTRNRMVDREVWPVLSAAACALFGLLFLLNTHTIGDGLWFWYASALQQGQKLYSGLHIPMQPLFIFATEWNQRLLGNSWLASKFLAALQDILYCWGLYLVTRRIPWPGYQRALLIAATFGITIMAFYYRFDDYHITGHCLLVFSIYVCLQLEHARTARGTLLLAGTLGLLAGLSIANRLNDGAFLFVASAAAIVVLLRRQRFAAAAVFCSTAAAVVLLLIAMTGDSLRTWADQTIFRASAIKGGTGRIFYAPFHFPIATRLHLQSDRLLIMNMFLTYAVILTVAVGMYLLRTRRAARLQSFAFLTIGIAGALYAVRQANSGTSVLAMADTMILWCYGILFCFVLRFGWLMMTGELRSWNPQEVLFLFPFGQLVSGAMTSGESFLEAYPAIAMLLLVAPFVFPALSTVRILRGCFLTLLALLAGGTVVAKWSHPYYWHHFNNGAMFTNRVWYPHPQYGPMYIERPQLDLASSICRVIRDGSDAPPQLLAMPWPYPNYFCNLPPWHGYVQTWYDTTSRATIAGLMTELQSSPPEWIAYQRATDSIWIHEQVFFHGTALPHRALDDMITGRLRSGAWTLSLQRCYSGADWLLIHTRPVRSGEPNDTLIPSSDRLNLCSRTAHGFLR